MPRGQGWNAKRLRDDGSEDGKTLVPGAEGMAGAANIGGVAIGLSVAAAPAESPAKKSPPGSSSGFKRDHGVRRLQGTPATATAVVLEPARDVTSGGRMAIGMMPPEAWAAEKAQLVNENQHLRSIAASASAEAEERRRANAELEKAKAEIER